MRDELDHGNIDSVAVTDIPQFVTFRFWRVILLSKA